MSEKGMPDVCCFCRSRENLIQAYRIEKTCAGREFNIYFSCCKTCLPKLEPGYSIIGDDETEEAEATETPGPAIVDTLYDSLWLEKKKKTMAPKKKKRRIRPGQLNLFEEEE
jgi:hypothetical protein